MFIEVSASASLGTEFPYMASQLQSDATTHTYLDWHQEWMNEIHQQMNAVFQEHFGW
jgi:hypothetical protein